MAKFRAKMRHDTSTVYKLIQTQFDTFQFHKKLIHAAISFGLILFGLYADSSLFMPMVALFVGCVMIANLNAYPKALAKKVLQQIGPNFPKSDYEFFDKEFSYNKEAEAVSYSTILRMVEDRQFFYLYVTRQAAYMVDKTTVTGGSAAELKQFLEIRTGLDFSRPNSFISFRLKDLFPPKDNTYRGPHL